MSEPSELMPLRKTIPEFLDRHWQTMVPAFASRGNPYLQFRHSKWVHELLESAITATDADFGNVQLFDSSLRVLKIVAQVGFSSEFLGYFENVNCEGGCACGVALRKRVRIVVPDVADDPIFSGAAREVLLRADARSVQSIPLIDPFGRFVGMVSTHHRSPRNTVPVTWRRVDEIVERIMAQNGGSPDRDWHKVALELLKEANTHRMSSLLKELGDLSSGA